MTLRAPLFTRRFSREVQPPQLHGAPLALIELAGDKPFSQTDWPNPQVPTQVQPEEFINQTVLAKVQDPFFLTEFPIPSEPRIQAPVHPVFPEVLLTGDKPFHQDDWPNPVLTVKVQTPFQVGIPITVLSTAGDNAFVQNDWPNPIILPVIQTPFQLGIPTTSIATAGTKPFNQTDWITPPALFIQEPLQYGAPINLFPIECNFDVYGCMAPVETDVLTAMVRNTDVLTAMVENTDVRQTISTDATDVLKEIVETDDVSGEIC